MAKSLSGVQAVSGAQAQAPSLRALRTLRLALGYVILLGSTVSVVGTSWDIQWHSFVGRDRTLIPPHIMILTGLTFSGLAALTAVLVETGWTRRNPQLAKYNTAFADYFHASFGSYIAGFAALNAAIAFPLDSYWHSLYGIDVQIWAPFHIMLIIGAAVVALGAAYMLISAAQLSTDLNERGEVRAGYIGAIWAFAVTFSFLSYLLVDATDSRGFFTFGNATYNLYPLLSGLMFSWLFVAAVYAIPWRRVASYLALAYLFIGVLFELFVPPATTWLVAQEQLQYRKQLGRYASNSIIALRFWSLTPLVAAILIDVLYRQAQRRHWSSRTLFIALALVSLIAALPLFILIPTLPIALPFILGAIGFPVSMLLGLGGTMLGTWFGQRMGRAMQPVERTA